MRAVQPSLQLMVVEKSADGFRVSLNPQVTFVGSSGSNLPAWVMNAVIRSPVSASTTLPKTSIDSDSAGGPSFFVTADGLGSSLC